MSDRLKELQRQRALMQEHLDWLDREIAAATSGSAPSPTPAVSVPSVAPIPPRPAAVLPLPTAARLGTTTTVAPVADEIIAQYQQPKESLHSSIRRGCFLYFFIALGLLAAGVIVLYLLRTRSGG